MLLMLMLMLMLILMLMLMLMLMNANSITATNFRSHGLTTIFSSTTAAQELHQWAKA